MRANLYPTLGNRPINEIEPMELVQLVKTIEARGAMDIAKRIIQVTGMIFLYAVAHGIAKRNPAAEFRPSILRSTPTSDPPLHLKDPLSASTKIR